MSCEADVACDVDVACGSTQATSSSLKVEFGGRSIASSRGATRTLETSHPPSYYIPQDDVDMECLRQSGGKSSFCEWKGSAIYYDVVVRPMAPNF